MLLLPTSTSFTDLLQVVLHQIEAHVNLPSSALKYVVEKVAAPVAGMASGDIAVHKSAPAALAGDAVAEVVVAVVQAVAVPVVVPAVAVPTLAVVAVFHLLMVL